VVNNKPKTGHYTFQIQALGDQGSIKLWADNLKRKEIPDGTKFDPQKLPLTVWAEGVTQSIVPRDAYLTLDYFDDGNKLVDSDSVNLTITPIVTDLSIKPGTVILDPTAGAGFKGIITTGPGGAWSGTVIKQGGGNARGKPNFIQFADSIKNGADGNGPGYVDNNGNGYNRTPLNLTFPILDAEQYSPPYYGFEPATKWSPDYSNVTSRDSPGSLSPKPQLQMKTITVDYNFSLYLVWAYPDNVFYTLAKINWDVQFRGSDGGMAGKFNVLGTSKIDVDQSFSLTNANLNTYNKKGLVVNLVLLHPA
jgi:hypothetical protein